MEGSNHKGDETEVSAAAPRPGVRDRLWSVGSGVHDFLCSLNERAAPKVKTLMQSLVYPAFLGTFLVSFVQDFSHAPLPALNWADPSTWWPFSWGINQWMPVWMLVYFASLFVETETTDAERYNVGTAAIDVIEVGVMFFAFRHLGYLEGVRNLSEFYAAMALAGSLPIIWRYFSKDIKVSFLNVLCILGIAALIRGSVLHWGVSTSPQPFGAADELIAKFLWGLMGAYLLVLAIGTWAYNRKGGETCLVRSKYQLASITLQQDVAKNDKLPETIPFNVEEVEVDEKKVLRVVVGRGMEIHWKLVGEESPLLT